MHPKGFGASGSTQNIQINFVCGFLAIKLVIKTVQKSNYALNRG